MALLRMCNASRLLEKAEYVFAEMNLYDISPPFEAFCIILRIFAEFEDRDGALPYLMQMKERGYELRSRSIVESIPTFFTMNEENRYRENIQGEMPYHPDLPAYYLDKNTNFEITYPYSSDLLFPQRDATLAKIEASRWEQFAKEYQVLKMRNETPAEQLSSPTLKPLSLEGSEIENEEQMEEFVLVKRKEAKPNKILPL